MNEKYRRVLENQLVPLIGSLDRIVKHSFSHLFQLNIDLALYLIKFQAIFMYNTIDKHVTKLDKISVNMFDVPIRS